MAADVVDVICGHIVHNTTKTVKRWRTKRDVKGRTHTIRADGTIIIPVGVRPPVFPDEDPDEHTPDEIARLEQLARNRLKALSGSAQPPVREAPD